MMQKEIHLQNKKIINILAISGIITLFIAFFFNYKCIFKSLFNIPCISCGLTRGFKYIIKFDLINATRMNLLSVPLFITLTIFYILYFIWLILKKDYIFNFFGYFVKHYKILVVILLLSWGIKILEVI